MRVSRNTNFNASTASINKAYNSTQLSIQIEPVSTIEFDNRPVRFLVWYK